MLTGESRHHLPLIVVGEYRYGLLRSRQGRLLGELLDTLVRESIVLAIDLETTAAYAEVRQGLRRQGTPIPENDVWIAALARQHGLPVVSRDEHFDRVRGITRQSW